MGVAFTFPFGIPQKDKTAITLTNNTARTENKVVPDTEMWLVDSIVVSNPDNVARDIEIYALDSGGGDIVKRVAHHAAVVAGGYLQFPNGQAEEDFSNQQAPLIVGPGNVIRVVWQAGGASAGGTDAAGQIIFYRKMKIKDD